MVDFCTKTSIKFSFPFIFLFFKLCWYKTQINSTQHCFPILYCYRCFLKKTICDFNEDCWFFSKQATMWKSRVRSWTSAPNYSWFYCFRNVSISAWSHNWANDAGIKNIPEQKKSPNSCFCRSSSPNIKERPNETPRISHKNWNQ